MGEEVNKRGKLILIEGTDCSGKSTQAQKLITQLAAWGYQCVYHHFPNYFSPTGKVIKRYLENEFGPANEIDPKVASLLYAEDRFAFAPQIRKWLDEGKIVILDRYVESNMGHQGGKIRDAEERKSFFKWLEDLEYGNFDLPKPDAVLFLYMPYQIGLELKNKRTLSSEAPSSSSDGHENSEHLRNAEEAYLQLARMYNWIKIDCAPDGTITSLKSPDKIAEEVYQKVKSSMQYNEKDRKILNYFFSNLDSPIFAAKNFHPEVWALMQDRKSVV
jgi:dTMP kinase